ncbi:CRE-SRXA-11 protein [Caenorhabditis remanei]|uniref:CRE-SRXA-11 protein n=1 Tax=Caenorhabditis remanei TaxID=31234 RepID=E3M0J5_CAERE|nr:CRE-SRXA-11 protein [Caenorhabditis remanei]
MINYSGRYFSLLDDFVYYFPMSLTVLMVVQRIYAVLNTLGNAFANGKLIVYCIVLSLILFSLMLFPFFSECASHYDNYLLEYVSGCAPNVHIITHLFSTYNWIVPVVSMLFNILIILHFSYKRKRTMRITSNARQSQEKILVVQSVATTTFILSFEITSYFNDLFYTEYMSLAELDRRIISYSRSSLVTLTCFFIYFIGTPGIRKILLEKMRTSTGNRKNTTTIVAARFSDSNKF